MSGLAPEIEVVVVTYNRADFLPLTLETLLSQTRPPTSIRVVDNGSTDKTAEILEPFGARGVKTLQREKNDFAACWDEIRRTASSEWVMVFHDDDLLHPGYLEAVSQVIGTEPETTLVGCSMTAGAAPESGNWPDVSWKRNSGLIPLRELACRLYSGFRLPFCSAVYRTEVFRRIPLGMEIYGKICDRPFLMEAARAGGAVLLSDPFVKYRLHPGQDSQTSANGPFLPEVFALQHYYLDAMGDDPRSASGRAFLRRNYRNLANEFERLGAMDPTLTRDRFFREALSAGAATPRSLELGAAYSAMMNWPRRIERTVKRIVRGRESG